MQDYAAAGSDMYTFHLEAVVGEPVPAGSGVDERVAALIKSIKVAGMHAGIAIKPATAAEAVFPYVEECGLDLVSSGLRG